MNACRGIFSDGNALALRLILKFGNFKKVRKAFAEIRFAKKVAASHHFRCLSRLARLCSWSSPDEKQDPHPEFCKSELDSLFSSPGLFCGGSIGSHAGPP